MQLRGRSDVVAVYKRLFAYLRPHWLIMALAVVPASIYALLNTTVPLVMREVIDRLEHAAKASGHAWEIPVLIAVLFPLRAVMDFLTIYGLSWVGRSVIRDLRTTWWGFDTKERVLFPGDGFAYSASPQYGDRFCFQIFHVVHFRFPLI